VQRFPSHGPITPWLNPRKVGSPDGYRPSAIQKSGSGKLSDRLWPIDGVLGNCPVGRLAMRNSYRYLPISPLSGSASPPSGLGHSTV
jgi:hypothetical protein